MFSSPAPTQTVFRNTRDGDDVFVAGTFPCIASATDEARKTLIFPWGEPQERIEHCFAVSADDGIPLAAAAAAAVVGNGEEKKEQRHDEVREGREIVVDSAEACANSNRSVAALLKQELDALADVREFIRT